jgi:uncharacterized protein (TIGR02452 family)
LDDANILHFNLSINRAKKMSGKIDKIIDGLYIGNHYAALDQEVINTYNIKTVINCTKKDERINMTINYLQIPLDDPPTDQDIQLLNKTFYPSILFIDNSIKSGNNVLVHCKIGSQRSATVVAIYLMVKYSTNYEDAINFVQSIRPIAFFGTIAYLDTLKFVQDKLNQINKSNINGGNNLSKLFGNKTNNKTNKASMNPFAYRKHIYDENKFLCLEGKFAEVESYPSELIEFNNSILPIPLYEPATVQVLDMDCLQVAKMMIGNNFKPLVLNIANVVAPCGNTFKQNNLLDAQEELLFCRTNYFKTLNVNTNFYPIDKSVGIYSPQVLVFRDEELEMIDEPYFVSFVASSPIVNPRLMNGRMNEQDHNLTFAKIDTVFQIGMAKGFDSIVLGAYGCGHHANPPYQIVEIFNKCLQRWKNNFKVIVFAIPSHEKMYGKNVINSVCNFNFFKKYIKV